MFRLGYNTNGLSFHRIGDAIDLLADLGYEGIAITPDVGPLDPFELDRRTVADVRQRLDDAGLEVAIETGARYVLDPRRKHRPTLLRHFRVETARSVSCPARRPANPGWHRPRSCRPCVSHAGGPNKARPASRAR